MNQKFVIFYNKSCIVHIYVLINGMYDEVDISSRHVYSELYFILLPPLYADNL